MLYPDDQLTISALQDEGLFIQIVPWDKKTVKWNTYDAVIIRCTSQYYLQSYKFVQWTNVLESMRVNMWNPAKAIRWNINKRYLLELAKNSISIIPTILLKQHPTDKLYKIMNDNKWNEVVIKPVIGAGSHNVFKAVVEQIEEKQQELSTIFYAQDVIVQPLIREVFLEGEYSFVFIGDKYSHAVIKRLPARKFTARRNAIVEKIEPNMNLLEQAEKIYSALPKPLLFARIDGLNVKGNLQLMEVELIEPTLYLSANLVSVLDYAKAVRAII